jgi:hypothetical protein
MSKDLKKIIKPLIKECLLEIFAEMKLESIVENVVQKHQSNYSIAEQVIERPMVKPAKKSVDKRSLMKAIGVDESTWANIYDDTLNSGNQILSEAGRNSAPKSEMTFDDTELVSESILEQAGLLKDYSKFIK